MEQLKNYIILLSFDIHKRWYDDRHNGDLCLEGTFHSRPGLIWRINRNNN